MTIFTGFSPNLTGKDTLKALGWLFFPWKWPWLCKGENPLKVESQLEKFFSAKHAKTFDSGRTALYFALKALDIEKGDEVLVQAFTCMVVSNAINWAGAKPVYVDVCDDFNMDPDDLNKKISTKTKAVIVQHTFGMPARLEEIMAIAEAHSLPVIEDCAHSFGARHNGRLTGTFGRIGMFSFGSDKILSCGRGGALITNDPRVAEKLEDFQARLEPLSKKHTIRHLVHYPVFYLSKPLYGFVVGKAILWLAKKLYLMNKIITGREKRGEKDELFGRLLPNSLADILLGKLKEAHIINEHRKKIAAIYDKELFGSDARKRAQLEIKNPLAGANIEECVYLRYPILSDNPKQLMEKAKNNKIILGDWYNAAIAPRDSMIEKSGYLPGSCPKAEYLSVRVVNLPTDRHIDEKKAGKIIGILMK